MDHSQQREERGQLRDSKSGNAALSEVYEVHQNLMNTIQEMDEKIEEVIKQHEAQFLFAYRNHIKRIKQELSVIKQRSDEQQKNFLSNDRTIFLQKQLVLFREQALKLYDKLQQKSHQADIFRSKVKQLQRLNIILEKQNRDLIKNAKNFEGKNSLNSNRIQELQEQLVILREQFKNQKDRNKNSLTKGYTNVTLNESQNNRINNQKSSNINYIKAQKVLFNTRQQFAEGENQQKSGAGSRSSQKHGKYSFIKSRKASHKKSILQTTQDHELKNWFLECIQSIRKEVAQRKVYGGRFEDLNMIGSLEQFRMIDKLRLLEMFMQNEKLLVYMYQKIFPNRISEVSAYLSNKSQPIQPKQKSKSVNIRLGEFLNSDAFEEIAGEEMMGTSLPKVSPLSDKKPKFKKYDVRNKIEIKNGKLNFSMKDN